MPRSFNVTIALSMLMLAIRPSSAWAAGDGSKGMPHSYVGIQGLAIVGVHRDIAGSQHGVGAGPLAQVHIGLGRMAAQLEGIPVVSIPGTQASAHYGQATPALGIFNGAMEYALSGRRRGWVGIGETIYNQRTPLPNLEQRVSSRLAGVRYTARYRAPLRNAHFVEGFLGITPALWGADRYVYSDGITPTITKDERASEVDASLALGWDRNASEWLIGLRALNFSAKYTQLGDAADRNVGVGMMLEWRHIIRQ